MNDMERLNRGDIWSNKKGWMTRGEAARDTARQMLPMYRCIWAEHIKTDITDDELIDYVATMRLTPTDAAFG